MNEKEHVLLVKTINTHVIIRKLQRQYKISTYILILFHLHVRFFHIMLYYRGSRLSFKGDCFVRHKKTWAYKVGTKY